MLCKPRAHTAFHCNTTAKEQKGSDEVMSGDSQHPDRFQHPLADIQEITQYTKSLLSTEDRQVQA